jgi:hypothetical protein
MSSEGRWTMALPYDQIEALAQKLAVANIGADENEEIIPKAKAVIGDLDLEDLVTVLEIAVEVTEYRQENLQKVLDDIRTELIRQRLIDEARSKKVE